MKKSRTSWKKPFTGAFATFTPAFTPCHIVALLLAATCAGRAAETGDAEFQTGLAHFIAGEFEEAEARFEESGKLAENAVERARGLYALAEVYNHKTPGRDEAKAVALYNQAVEADPGGEWAPWAALALARMPVFSSVDTLPSLAQLEEAFGKVMRDHPGHAAADEAFLLLQNQRLQRLSDGPLDRAVEALEKWVEERKESAYLVQGYNLLAHGYFLQQKHQRHVDTRRALLELLNQQKRDNRVPQTDPATFYFQLAMAAQNDVGDFELARKYYTLLIEESPAHQLVFWAEKHLEMMDAFEAEVKNEKEAE